MKIAPENRGGETSLKHPGHRHFLALTEQNVTES